MTAEPDPRPRFRLCPGTTVLARTSGWTIHTPSQEVLEIDCPDDDQPAVAAFLSECSDGRSSTATEDLAPLVEYLLDERALDVLDDSTATTACRIWQSQDLDPKMLQAVLDQRAVEPTESPNAPLLAVAGWLPDEQWCVLDEVAVDTDTWWIPVYAEGATWYAGPLRTGATEHVAGYRDLRIRRLAASPCPARLDELWASNTPPARSLHRVAEQVAALEYAIDVVRSTRSSSPEQAAPGDPLINRQWGFHADGTRNEHPVLPVPLHLVRDASTVRDGAS